MGRIQPGLFRKKIRVSSESKIPNVIGFQWGQCALTSGRVSDLKPGNRIPASRFVTDPVNITSPKVNFDNPGWEKLLLCRRWSAASERDKRSVLFKRKAR
jgi:hypothetical protein